MLQRYDEIMNNSPLKNKKNVLLPLFLPTYASRTTKHTEKLITYVSSAPCVLMQSEYLEKRRQVLGVKIPSTWRFHAKYLALYFRHTKNGSETRRF